MNVLFYLIYTMHILYASIKMFQTIEHLVINKYGYR